MREKFIPRPKERPESGISGLDSFNLEPMTGNAGKIGNSYVNVIRKFGQAKTPWHGRGGTGINPDKDIRHTTTRASTSLTMTMREKGARAEVKIDLGEMTMEEQSLVI